MRKRRRGGEEEAISAAAVAAVVGFWLKSDRRKRDSKMLGLWRRSGWRLGYHIVRNIGGATSARCTTWAHLSSCRRDRSPLGWHAMTLC